MRQSVIVVGAGIVGCSTAYFAAREGLTVTLVESRTVAHGASGRNPGFVWLHCRNPGFALDASRASRRLYPELQQELPGGFEFRAEGGLMYFTTDEQGRIFKEFVDARRADGLDIELIDGAQVRELVPPIREDVAGASFCAEDAQINTPGFVAALARGVRQHGGQLLEGVTASSLLYSGGEVVGVRTNDGDLHADAVVLATGGWSGRLLESLGIDAFFSAERLQMVATRPLPLQIRPVVYGPRAAKQYKVFSELPSWDAAHFSDLHEPPPGLEVIPLAAQRANGEILLGCSIDHPPNPQDRDWSTTLDGLQSIGQAIREDFPSLADVPIDRVWAGVLSLAPDMMPVLDEVRPNAFLAAGYVFGNSAGPISGRLVTQLLLGHEPELDIAECRYDRDLPPTPTGTEARW